MCLKIDCVFYHLLPPSHYIARMRTHAHTCVVNMIISCKWLPPLGKSLGIPYDVICACACVRVRACACMCTCVRGTLSPTPNHIHPPPHPPGGAPPESIKIQHKKPREFIMSNQRTKLSCLTNGQRQ